MINNILSIFDNKNHKMKRSVKKQSMLSISYLFLRLFPDFETIIHKIVSL